MNVRHVDGEKFKYMFFTGTSGGVSILCSMEASTVCQAQCSELHHLDVEESEESWSTNTATRHHRWGNEFYEEIQWG
jgi:hypothetical protein